MKREIPGLRQNSWAFTLIELLVVIAIIATLAALLLPTFGKARTAAKVSITKTEMANLNAAIATYQATYGRLPASTYAISNASVNVNQNLGSSNDFTFGTAIHTPLSPTATSVKGTAKILSSSTTQIATGGVNYQNANSEIISILRDDNVFPETETVGATTYSHRYNPGKTSLFTAKPSLDTSSPGIGPDDVLRDAWGTPFIVTLDMNYDNKCYDFFWTSVYGVPGPAQKTNFSVPASSMIWSFGPTKTISFTNGPKETVNKTIVKSWE